MKKFVSWVISAFFLLALNSCIKSHSASENVEKIDTLFYFCYDSIITEKAEKYFKYLTKNTNFNGAIIIGYKGKIVYENYYGIANKEKKDTINSASTFQLCSASKQFTAMAVMILKEENKLSYDDNVEKYVPDFPYKGITIKMLLTHRSGLSNYLYFCENYTDRVTPIDNKKVIQLMIDSVPTPYLKPNERFNYCNTNYMLLAYIVEKVSGMRFSEFLRQRIFKPLKMNSTYVLDINNDTVSNQTKGYHHKWLEALRVYQDGVVGDKNIYTTVRDMFIWQHALFENTLVSSQTFAEAMAPQSPERKGKRNYGFGYRLLKENDSTVIPYHGGWWRGNNVLFMMVPRTKSCIIIFANVRTNSFSGTYRELLEALDTTLVKNIEADLSSENEAVQE